MAHEITETDGIVLARKPAWHHLGIVLEQDSMTSKEALEYAGLGWTVGQEPIYLGNGQQIPDRVANVRSDTGTALGIVGNKYVPTQNTEAFAFMDALQGHGVRYDVAGSLQGGRKVFLVAHLEREVMIGGSSDERIDPYIVLANGHDGAMALSVYMTPIRVVCMNTLSWSMKGAKNVWRTRHTANINARLDEARRTLGMANTYFDELERVGDLLIAKKVTSQDVSGWLEALFPASEEASDRTKESAKTKRDEVLTILRHADNLANVKDTAWGFAQAVAEWEDYGRDYRNDDVRFQSVVMQAYQNNVKTKALQMALAS